MGRDRRWNDSYEAHYRWCRINLRRHSERIVREDLARAEHLFKCGVRRRF